jgi:hypothetical protein
MTESREPDSNRTIERESHALKQFSHSRLTDDGMKIDESEAQHKNASLSITKSPEPLSNLTLEIVSLPQKLPDSNFSIVPGIVTSPPSPKYRFTEMPSKSSRKSPITLTWQLPSQTESARGSVPASGERPNSSSLDGMQSDQSVIHHEKTSLPACKGLEPGSNATMESLGHDRKHSSESHSTEDGTHSDRIDQQYANANAPTNDSLQPDSNATPKRHSNRSKHWSQSFSTDEGMQIPTTKPFRMSHFPSPRISLTSNANPAIET